MADMLPKDKSLFVSVRIRLLLAFTLVFTAAFAYVFYWFYNYAAKVALAQIQKDVQQTLGGAIAGIDVGVFKDLVDEDLPIGENGYPTDERYWSHVLWLRTVENLERRAFPYTYTWAKDDPTKIMFIGSSGATKNPPEGVTYRYIPPADASTHADLLPGLKEITYPNDFKPYIDEWGEWVSVFAPIKDDRGVVIGAMGIDFKASYVREVQEEVRNQMAITFLIIYVVMIALVFFIGSGLTRPIGALTVIARRIAEGDYEQDLSVVKGKRMRDEIGDLARVFEIMIDKVQEREENLKMQIVELQIEIDSDKRKSQVDEIVDTDFFRELQIKALNIRERRMRGLK